MRILSGGGINWSWFMHLTVHKDGTCTVEKEYRLHDDSHLTHPKAVGGYYVVEREGKRQPGETFPPRIATAVVVTTYNGNDRARRRTHKLRSGPVDRWSFPSER